MDFLSIVVIGVVVIIGSLVFGVLMKNSIIINPSGMGFLSWWMSCVVGTGVVLYLVVSMFFGVVSWAINFVTEYYVYIIGGIIVLLGIGYWGSKDSQDEIVAEKQIEDKTE